MVKIVGANGKEITAKTGSAILPAAWIKMSNPDGAELSLVAKGAQLPEECLRQAVAEDMVPQAVVGENVLLVIVHVPARRSGDLYDIIPLSIVLTDSHIITVCREDTEVLAVAGADGGFSPDRRSRLFLEILHATDKLFLKHIRHIERRINETETMLRHSLENEELFQMLDLQKGLTHFTVALKNNGLVLESLLRARSSQRLQRVLEIYREEEDVFESVIIENKRALQLAETYCEITGGMMDAFSSVIAHNLNRVIKLLASITVLIAVPTAVSSFWSMSLPVPWRGTDGGFWYVLLLSLVITLTGWRLLKKKKLF